MSRWAKRKNERREQAVLSAGKVNRPRRLRTGVLIGLTLSAAGAGILFLLWLNGAFLPGWTIWENRELTAVMRSRRADEMYNRSGQPSAENKTIGESKEFCVKLKNRRVTVSSKTDGTTVLQTRPGLKVSDAGVGDLDGDGYDEIVLLLWKRGTYGTSHPFWENNDWYRYSQHVYIYTLREGTIVPWWFSSAIGIHAAGFRLTEYLDGKKQMVCLKEPDGEESSWYWHGFGLAKMEKTDSALAEAEKTSGEGTEEQRTVRLIAFGDNLISDAIYNAAYDESSGDWDFSSLYSHIADRVKQYDLAALNEETILVHDPAERSSFPRFGTPDVIGRDIRQAGFNIVTAATNHAWDKGEQGITDTLQFWKQYPDVTLLGIHGSQEEQDKITYVEKKGIRFALFNYTNGLSAGSLPEDQTYYVDLLKDKDKLLSDLQEAEQSADLSIVFLHMGTEYRTTPTDEQKELAEELTEAGADLIIGTHPHCVEPMEHLTAENGNTSVVYYSLGNLVSTQTKIVTVLGGAADVTVVRDKGSVSIQEAKLLPTVCHIENAESAFSSGVSVDGQIAESEEKTNRPLVTAYFLSDYTEELAQRHWLRQFGQDISLDSLKNLWQEVSGQTDSEKLSVVVTRA